MGMGVGVLHVFSSQIMYIPIQTNSECIRCTYIVCVCCVCCVCMYINMV